MVTSSHMRGGEIKRDLQFPAKNRTSVSLGNMNHTLTKTCGTRSGILCFSCPNI